MHFNETLLLFGNRQWLAVGIADPTRSSGPYRCCLPDRFAVSHLASVGVQGNAATGNLGALFSQPLPSGAQDATLSRNSLLHYFMQKILPKDVAGQMQQWQASMFPDPQEACTLYPRQVLLAANGLSLVQFSYPTASGSKQIAWLVDVVRNSVLHTHLAGIHFGKDYAHAQWCAISDDGALGLLRLPYSDTLRAYRFEIRALTSGSLRSVFLSPCGHTTQHAFWNGRWIIVGPGKSDKNTDIVLCDALRGTELMRYTVRGSAGAGFSVNAQGLCALGLFGGTVSIVDLVSGTQRLLRPHIGVSRNDYADVSLNNSGTHLLSAVGRQLCLTRLDGDAPASCDAGLLPQTETQSLAPGLELVFQPGFTLCDEQFGIVHRGQTSWHALDAISAAWRPALASENKPLTSSQRRKKLENIDNCLTEYGLTRIAAPLLRYLKPAIRFRSARKLSLHKVPIGSTRLGGYPDLISAKDWPQWDGRPMTFIAQINLADVAEACPGGQALPQSGLLSFFLGSEGDEYDNPALEDKPTHMTNIMLGSEAGHREGWKVIYQPAAAMLAAAQPDISAGHPDFYSPCPLKIKEAAPSLPHEESVLITALHLTPVELEGYQKLAQLVNGDGGGDGDGEEQHYHQLLGHPDPIQDNSMECVCEQGWQGKDPYTYPEDETARQQLFADATNWTLLLQLEEDEHSNFCWGDAGALYWFIRRDALAQGDFSQTWIVLQSH